MIRKPTKETIVLMVLAPVSACATIIMSKAAMHSTAVAFALSATMSLVLMLLITACVFYTQRRNALFHKEMLGPELFEEWQRGRTHKW